MLATGLALLALAGAARALFANEAGVLDWHTKLVGTPLALVSQNSHIFVATNKNVVASIETKSGNIVWRQLLGKSETLNGIFAPTQNILVTVSSAKVAHVRAWSPKTGNLLWETPINSISESADAKCTAAAVSVGSSIAVVLSSCDVALLSSNGNLHWTVAPKSDKSFTRIAVTDSHVYAASWSQETSVLVVRTYNIKNGIMSAESETKDVHLSGPENVFLIEKDGDLYLIWNDNAKHASFGRHLSQQQPRKLETPDHEPILWLESVSIDQGSASAIVKTQQGVHAARIDAQGNVKIDHTFSNLQDARGSIHVSTVDPDGTRLFGRLQPKKESQGSYNLELWSSVSDDQSILARIDSKIYGKITKVFLTDNGSSAKNARFGFVAITQDGSVHSFSGSKLVWTRDEAHSQAVSSVLVDVPSSESFSEALDELNEEPKVTAAFSMADRYLHRWKIQMTRAKSAIDHFMYPKAHNETQDSDDGVVASKDPHGFQKLLLLATSTGRVSALNTATGKVAWSRFFDGVSADDIHVVRKARVKYPPVVAIIGRSPKGSFVWRVNALSGKDYVAKDHPHIPAKTSFDRPGEFFPIHLEDMDDHMQVLLFVDKNNDIELYPATEASRAAFEGVRDRWHFYRIDGETRLHGFDIQDARLDGKYPIAQTWKIDFSAGERISSLASQRCGEYSVASIGKVLGDRKVLYKYLNSNLIGIITTLKGEGDHVTTFFYVIDAVSGAIHLRNTHHGAGQVSDDTRAIYAIQCENWFVYTVWNHGQQAVDRRIWSSLEEPVAQTSRSSNTANGESSTKDGETNEKQTKRRKSSLTKKNYSRSPIPNAKQLELVVLEVYENATPDKRLDSLTMTSYSSARPAFQGQSYVFPMPISAIGVTQTEAGITTREILFGVDGGLLYGLNKRALDPRRPMGKPNADEKEEGLVQYAANMGFNPLSVASYNLEVLGIETILSSPTNLESTSIVAAHGLDLFCTRRTPSGSFDVLSPDFNYVALVTTIIALGVGVVLAKTFADRKRLNDLWKH